MVADGVLRRAGPLLKRIGIEGRLFVVTHRSLWKWFGPGLKRSIRRSGIAVTPILVPEGERAKSSAIVERVTTQLIRMGAERSSALVCLGGGVVGDLGGFAAAIYLRGIPVVQIPTTLIAQVDAAIGGKTGINHPLGKNLIGAFHQPRLVLVDPKFLATLSTRQFVSGLAEAIKYGIIRDAGLFRFLEREMLSILQRSPRILTALVARCAANKAWYVERDEYERTGLRAQLNFGHTVGHVLETLGHYRRFTHGEAVALGMVAEGLLSRQLGILRSDDDLSRMIILLAEAGLPVKLPIFPVGQMMMVMRRDKKVKGGRIRMVLMERIGKVRLISLSERELKKSLSQLWS